MTKLSAATQAVQAEPVEASAVQCVPFDRLRANGEWLGFVADEESQ
jgi:hypothetical protein